MSIDQNFYTPAVLEILKSGFDSSYYLEKNPDVAKNKVVPFEHFINYGLEEKRTWKVKGKTSEEYKFDLFFAYKQNLCLHLSEVLKVSNLTVELLINFIEQEVDEDSYIAALGFKVPTSFIPYHILLNYQDPKLKVISELPSILSNLFESLEDVDDAMQQAELVSSINLKDGLAHIDAIFIGENVAFLLGWEVHNYGLSDINLKLNGEKVCGNCKTLRFARADVSKAHPGYKNVDKPGFLSVVELSKSESLLASREDSKLTLSFSNNISVKTLDILNKEKLTRAALPAFLSSIEFNDIDLKLSWDEIFSPVLDEVFAIGGKVDATTRNFGQQPENPDVSIIIPLYGRIDFVQYQLSRFSAQQRLNNAEIIYILDDPSISQECLNFCQQVYSWTEQSFKLVTMSRNMGFGRVNNIAADIAASENLILLNSDVLPIDGNWASKIVSYLNSDNKVGVVGTRLLFEDGSIQHDGMVSMHLEQYPDLVFNDHPQKGWPVELSPNSATFSECELVTAACVAIKKSVFMRVGGFDEQFYLGDFEDSDLCRKLLKLGYKNYIARDISLNHLERQSQNLVEAGNWKHNLTIINAIHYKNRIDRDYDFLESN